MKTGQKISRRRLLMASGAVALLAGLGVNLGRLRERVRAQPDAGRIPTILETMVTFIATLFGRVLSEEDAAELEGRLRFTIDTQPARAAEYGALADHLDSLARRHAVAPFRAAHSEVKARVTDEFMRANPRTRLARWLGHLSHGWQRRAFARSVTVPQLAWLYRNSGVPWRARGYTRWPGVPGAWQEYMRAARAP